MVRRWKKRTLEIYTVNMNSFDQSSVKSKNIERRNKDMVVTKSMKSDHVTRRLKVIARGSGLNVGYMEPFGEI